MGDLPGNIVGVWVKTEDLGPGTDTTTLVGTWSKTNYTLTFTASIYRLSSGGTEMQSGTYTYSGNRISFVQSGYVNFSGTAKVSNGGNTLVISDVPTVGTFVNGTWTRQRK